MISFMIKEAKQLTVAVVQAAPVFMDAAKTVEKAVKLIHECADNGSQLILFPEAFIPCYPKGLTFGTVMGWRTKEGREDWRKYYENCVDVPGIYTDILGDAAKETGNYVCMGVMERDGATVYCTMLYFGPDGTLLGKHRKLKPTASERHMWGEGDGSTLTTIETKFGTIGGLICWENYMPLARAAMYRKGVDIYLLPTADHRNEWQGTIQHIAQEGRCFVLNANMCYTKSIYPQDLNYIEDMESYPEIVTRGGSAIIDPFGKHLAGPVFDTEEILYANLDLNLIAEARYDLDCVGHYSRPDVFTLIVNEQKLDSVKFNKKEC